MAVNAQSLSHEVIIAVDLETLGSFYGLLVVSRKRKSGELSVTKDFY